VVWRQRRFVCQRLFVAISNNDKPNAFKIQLLDGFYFIKQIKMLD